MADPKTTLECLIEEHGGVLVRKNKHKVYRFPNGSTLVVACTPEDYRAYNNTLAHAKKMLGVHEAERGAPGDRREKRIKRKSGGSKMLPNTFHAISTASWTGHLENIKTELAKPQKVKSAPCKIKHPVHNPSKPSIPSSPIEVLHLRIGTQV